MHAIERLETLLDERDAKIEELEIKLEKLQDKSERTWDWARHTQLAMDLFSSLSACN